MEEILEGTARIIWGVLRWFIWEFVAQVVLFNIGRALLLIVTLGCYPRGELKAGHYEAVMLVGLLLAVATLIGVSLANR